MANSLSIFNDKRIPLTGVCQRYRVHKLYLFGSALTENFDRNTASDLDFYVEMEEDLQPLERGENLLQLWNSLEELFGRPIDLLSNSSLQNLFLKRQIDATKVIVYDGSSQEVLV